MYKSHLFLVSLLLLNCFTASSQNDFEEWLRRRTHKESFSGLYSLQHELLETFPDLEKKDIMPVLGMAIDSIYEEVIEHVALCYEKKFSPQKLKKIMRMEPEEIVIKYEEEITEIVNDQADFVKQLQDKYIQEINQKLHMIDFKKEDYNSDSCTQFKDGIFQVLNVPNNIYFERKGSEQVEYYNDKILEGKVEWTGKCTYNLEIISTDIEESIPSIGSVVEVKMCDISGDYVKLKVFAPYWKEYFTMELKKLK